MISSYPYKLLMTFSSLEIRIIRATSKVSLYHFLLIGIKTLMKNTIQQPFLIGSLILMFSILDFSLVKDEEYGWLFIVRTRYKEAIGRMRKAIESNIYSNDFLNEDLESEFQAAWGIGGWRLHGNRVMNPTSFKEGKVEEWF